MVETDVPQPLFHRTWQSLAARIERGDLAPGDRLPSERWLGEELGVSRTTVRRAVEELARQGLVEERGRAVFVAARAEPANPLVSLSEAAGARGLEATARVLRADIRPSTLDEADAFGIAAGADLFELERVRLLDGLEVAVDHNRVPRRVLPGAPAIDFTTASLYGALGAAGHAPTSARTRIEAAAAGDHEARLLGLDAGAPVLVATDQVRDRSGRVVALGRTAYRSDRHRFLATFTRGTGP
jgi:GntR family transcriptional regulator